MKVNKTFLGAYAVYSNRCAVPIKLDIFRIRDAVDSVDKALERVCIGKLAALEIEVERFNAGRVRYRLTIGFSFFTLYGKLPICYAHIKRAMLEERGEKLAPRFVMFAVLELENDFLAMNRTVFKWKIIVIRNTVGVTDQRGKAKLCF